MIARLISLFTFVLGTACPMAVGYAQPSKPSDSLSGESLVQLEFQYGSIWGGGFKIVANNSGFAVLEHEKCKREKERDRVTGIVPRGLCVTRISEKKFEEFLAALAPLRQFAKPFQVPTSVGNFVRPDGKPCGNKVTDAGLFHLTWVGERGVETAEFYTGCDREEFKVVYDRLYKIPQIMTSGDPFK